MRTLLAIITLLIGCSSSRSAEPLDSSSATTCSAFATVGGLDHLRIVKVIDTACFSIDLVNPGSNGSGVTLPTGWGFVSAQAMQPSGACTPNAPIGATAPASHQTGAIGWQVTGTPTIVENLHVTLTFDVPPEWCPPVEVLDAANVSVHWD